MDNQYSLLELNQLIKQNLKSTMPNGYWVRAEISELNINYNGHCYIELIEKKKDSDQILARSRAVIWSFTYRMLEPYFRTSTGENLKAGIKVLFLLKVQFHEQYGLSLEITDVDPTYTIGEQAMQRKITIDQLVADGVIDMNKELYLALAPQSIAIVSSETAAGFQDFIEQLKQNPFRLKFRYKLFPAIMQGDKSEESIIQALNQIFESEYEFDIITIIRGGGAKTDLSSFDSYNLALNIAQFPVPIITGIGHFRDETVADIVAYKSLKTPTAVADYIIEQCLSFSKSIDSLASQIITASIGIIERQKSAVRNIGQKLQQNSIGKLAINKSELSIKGNRMTDIVNYKLKTQHLQLNESQSEIVKLVQQKLEHQNIHVNDLKDKINNTLSRRFDEEKVKHNTAAKLLHAFSPEHTLKRGFSITKQNGKVLTNINQIEESHPIETILHEGIIFSTVNTSKHEENKK